MSQTIRFSLKYKLFLLLTSITGVVLFIILLLAIHLFEVDKMNYVFNSTRSVSVTLAQQVKSKIQTLFHSITPILSGFRISTNAFTEDAKKYFQKLEGFENLGIFTQNGQGDIVLLGKLIKKKNASHQIFSQVLSPKSAKKIISGLEGRNINLGSGIQGLDSDVLVFTFLFSNSYSEKKYYSISLVRMRNLFKTFREKRVYSNFLIDFKGRMILGPEAISEENGFEKWSFMKPLLNESEFDDQQETESPNGVKYILSHSKTGLGGLAVVSLVEKNKTFKAIAILVIKSLLFLLSLISLVTIVSIITSHQLTSALRKLYAATGKIAHGDFNIKLKEEGSDEVAQLSSSLNKMAGEVSRLLEDNIEKVRMEKELETARTVQKTLFPRMNGKFGNTRISGFYEPANECGGDWWNYCEIDNRVFLWIGDATGHGAGPALITSAAKSASSIIQSFKSIQPGKALELMNQAIYETSKQRIMMTFFLGALDQDTGKFTYAMAGHNPPYLFRFNKPPKIPTDLIALNKTQGNRLGAKPDSTYPEAEITLDERDSILFYTDGFTELVNPAGMEFGKKKVFEICH